MLLTAHCQLLYNYLRTVSISIEYVHTFQHWSVIDMVYWLMSHPKSHNKRNEIGKLIFRAYQKRRPTVLAALVDESV